MSNSKADIIGEVCFGTRNHHFFKKIYHLNKWYVMLFSSNLDSIGRLKILLELDRDTRFYSSGHLSVKDILNRANLSLLALESILCF